MTLFFSFVFYILFFFFFFFFHFCFVQQQQKKGAAWGVLHLPVTHTHTHTHIAVLYRVLRGGVFWVVVEEPPFWLVTLSVGRSADRVVKSSKQQQGAAT